MANAHGSSVPLLVWLLTLQLALFMMDVAVSDRHSTIAWNRKEIFILDCFEKKLGAAGKRYAAFQTLLNIYGIFTRLVGLARLQISLRNVMFVACILRGFCKPFFLSLIYFCNFRNFLQVIVQE